MITSIINTIKFFFKKGTLEKLKQLQKTRLLTEAEYNEYIAILSLQTPSMKGLWAPYDMYVEAEKLAGIAKDIFGEKQ